MFANFCFGVINCSSDVEDIFLFFFFKHWFTFYLLDTKTILWLSAFSVMVSFPYQDGKNTYLGFLQVFLQFYFLYLNLKLEITKGPLLM